MVQENWFTELIKLADDDWNKTHQHKMITDDQRYACKALGMKRDWMVEIPKEVRLTICPACMKDFPTGAIVCQNCRFIIDVEKYEKMKDRFAVQTVNA
jgi:RNase P subunit RPR2